MRSRDARDGGSLTILVLLVVTALWVVVVGAVVATSGDLVDAARARSAADAAALAGVGGGRVAAEELARANGAVLRSWRLEEPGTVVVEVGVGRAVAVARATDVP